MDFHLHLLIDAQINNPPKDPVWAKDWLERLITAVDMEKLGGPWATYCTDPENEGLTAQIWLTTSHSAFHCWNNCDQPFIKFDLYSCRPFEVDVVLNLFKEFEPVKGTYTLIDRTDTCEAPSITQDSIILRSL